MPIGHAGHGMTLGRQPNGHQIIEISTDLQIYPTKADYALVNAVGSPIQQRNNSGQPRVDVPVVPLKHSREIDRFDTNIGRFTSVTLDSFTAAIQHFQDSNVQQVHRVVLPMDLANAPLESFLRRVDPNQMNRPVVSVGTQSANANTIILTSNTNTDDDRPASTIIPRGQGTVYRY